MVQGLAFLSKKSWHTKNLNNQEKVWIAEERKKAEAAKTKELQKQIQQELEQQELDAIAGKKSRDRGIDWMYEHGPSSQVAQQDVEKKSEEYLLGKAFVPAGAPKGDLDVDNEQEGVNKVVSSAAAAVAVSVSISGSADQNATSSAAAVEPSVKERNEAFRIRFEDPMFIVAQQAVEKERKLERKKQLMEKVTGAVAVPVDVRKQEEVEETPRQQQQPQQQRKKEKKQKKRHREEDRKSKKKQKKRRRHHYSSSCSSSESEDDDKAHRHRHRRHRSRSDSRDRSASPDVSKRRRQDDSSVQDRDGKQRAKDYHGSSVVPSEGARNSKGSATGNYYYDERDRNRNRNPQSYRRNRSSRSESPDQNRHARGDKSSRRRDPDDEEGKGKISRRRRNSRSRSRSSEASERRGGYKSRCHEGRGDSHRGERERQEIIRVVHRRPHEDHDKSWDNRKQPPPPTTNPQSMISKDRVTDTDAKNDDERELGKRYGLQGSTAAMPAASLSILGPDEDLIRRKREEKLERKRAQEAAAQRRRMTPEERALALQEMEANARHHEQQRSSRLPNVHSSDKNEAPDSSVKKPNSSASFLHDLQKRAHGINNNGISLQERLQQNRNSNQKSHESFL